MHLYLKNILILSAMESTSPAVEESIATKITAEVWEEGYHQA
jgi:hypothetical protein